MTSRLLRAAALAVLAVLAVPATSAPEASAPAARAPEASAPIAAAPARPAQQGVDPADVGFDQNVGARLPLDARFVDETGAVRRLRDFFGERPVVVALVYYECPMLCTLVLNGLVATLKPLRELPGRDFDVVAISIDPGETPELAARKKARYVALYDRPASAAGWHFLTGDESAIRAVAGALGFRYVYDAPRDEYAHASGIVVATPQGVASHWFYGVEYPSKDVRLALVESSEGRLGSLVDQALLLCLHYDPTTGRYGLAILTVTRVLGVSTVLGLAAFMVVAARRGRRRRSTASPEPARA